MQCKQAKLLLDVPSHTQCRSGYLLHGAELHDAFSDGDQSNGLDTRLELGLPGPRMLQTNRTQADKKTEVFTS